MSDEIDIYAENGPVRNKRTLSIVFVSSLLTLILLSLCFTAENIAPFGNAERTLAHMDAGIQYNDFLAFYQNVFLGEASPLYSFSKGLGGNFIAVFSYYLCSPFNLLFLISPKDSIQIMFDIVVMLKLTTASITMSIFFCKRFPRIPSPLVVCMSLSFALMQYSLAQASNIMWLDSVYMLPLMAIATSNLIRNGHGIASLAFATGLSIIFNWYSGAINCLFLILWFFFELSLQSNVSGILNVAQFVISRGIRFALAMLLGVSLSLFILLPTALSLLGGRASSDAIMTLTWDYFYVDIMKVFNSTVIGSFSSQSFVSHYCGSIIPIGCVSLLFSKLISLKTRIVSVLFLFVVTILCYYQPLFIIFSLFIDASSYWFRYSYVCIFGFAAIAGIYFEAPFVAQKKTLETISVSHTQDKIQKHFAGYRATIPAAILICFSIVAVHLAKHYQSSSHVFATCLATIITGLILFLIGRVDPSSRTRVDNAPGKAMISPIPAVGIVILLCTELALNSMILINRYSSKNTFSRLKYVDEQELQINSLETMDSSVYRISQFPTYLTSETGLTANYNEGLAFGYPTIATYTSDPVNSQREFLNALGYPINGENMNIVNTSNLAADALLGVRYLLLNEEIDGLLSLDDLPRANGKTVYFNPYSLPLAFTNSKSLPDDLPSYEGNPFTFINKIYSMLLGRDIQLFYQVNSSNTSAVQKDRMITTYTLNNLSDGDPVYGNILLSNQMNPSTLTVNNKDLGYSQWLAPSVFYIDGSAQPTVAIDAAMDNGIIDAQFYALNLDALSEAVNELKKGGPSTIQLGLNSAIIDAENTDGSLNLFTTIPIDDGWNVKVNGRRVEPDLVFGCFMSIPLDQGHNCIELSFIPKGLTIGSAVSSIALIVLIVDVLRIAKGALRARNT